MVRYICSDGQLFDSYYDAQIHENLLYEFGKYPTVYVMGLVGLTNNE
jgi:hypothetical protein